MGEGKNGEWSLKGAKDAQEYYQTHHRDHKKLMLSYDFLWLKKFYESKYKDTVR